MVTTNAGASSTEDTRAMVSLPERVAKSRRDATVDFVTRYGPVHEAIRELRQKWRISSVRRLSPSPPSGSSVVVGLVNAGHMAERFRLPPEPEDTNVAEPFSTAPPKERPADGHGERPGTGSATSDLASRQPPEDHAPAVPQCLVKPTWHQFFALPPRRPTVVPLHPLGGHRRRLPDRAVFEHAAAPVHDPGYERIASPGCSDRTIRRLLREGAEAGPATVPAPSAGGSAVNRADHDGPLPDTLAAALDRPGTGDVSTDLIAVVTGRRLGFALSRPTVLRGWRRPRRPPLGRPLGRGRSNKPHCYAGSSSPR